MVKALKLVNSEDAGRVVQRIINRMFLDGLEIEKAGTIANLLNTFLRALEVTKLEEIEERLIALEAERSGQVRSPEPQGQSTDTESSD
jgi:hypothetical protein